MFYLNVWLTVKRDEDIARVGELLATAQKWSREEPGNRRFEVYHSETDPRRYLLCEHWETKADWETHREAKAFREVYAPQVLPQVDREPHPSQLLD